MPNPSQLSLFGDEAQSDLFPAQPQPVIAADPDRVRARLHTILAEARAADTLPWDSRRLLLYRTIFPQMSLWLPQDEAAQLRLEFDAELVRLKAA